MERVIIFGVRGNGRECYLKLEHHYEIIAFADNDYSFYGQEFLGKKIISPEDIENEIYDKIIISSWYHYDSIKMQLCDLGISNESISDEFVKPHRNLFTRWEFEQNRLCDVMSILSEKSEAGENSSTYHDRWEKIKNNYSKIKFYMIYERYLGEFLVRFCTIIKNEKKEDGVLKVFLPCYNDVFVCNRKLVELLSWYIYLPYGEDLLFWKYVWKYRYKEVDLQDFTKYMLRAKWPPIKWTDKEKIIDLKESELLSAKSKMQQWGLSSYRYVCLGIRSGNYLNKRNGSDGQFSFRNAHYSNYKKVVNYLQKNGIKTVKMGREEDRIDDKNCIDYAGEYADDFLDLALFAHCKFAIVTTSGMWHLPTIFGRPVLVVNATSFTIACGGVPFTENDLYIPKKYRNTENGKYLSLKEIIEIDRLCKNKGIQLVRNHIEVIENSADEILEATKEMILRLEGKWKDEEIDEENYRKYERIINPLYGKGVDYQTYHSPLKCSDSIEQIVEDMSYCFSSWENGKGADDGPIPCRIATTWLRNNAYFLQ